MSFEIAAEVFLDLESRREKSLQELRDADPSAEVIFVDYFTDDAEIGTAVTFNQGDTHPVELSMWQPGDDLAAASIGYTIEEAEALVAGIQAAINLAKSKAS